VLDFGLAKAISPERSPGLKESMTPGQGALGSPYYMSPEQARAERVDHRTDIWSLGATLYTILAGVPPFNGATPNLVGAALLTEDFAPLATRRPDVPPPLDDLLRRCMTKNREQRMSSAREMLAALRALQPMRTSSPSFPKDTVRMSSAPSWPNVPISSGAPISTPLKETVPLATIPAVKKPPSRGVYLAIPIVLFVATIAIAAVAFMLRR
jgi:serine/threonine-protein kinase